MSDNYIEVNDLTVTIGKRTVLDSVSLKVEKQSIIGFVGRNGSGKTMLFRAIAGLIKTTDGEIYIDGKRLGKDISFPPDLGIIIENVNLWSYMTGMQALTLLADINKKLTRSDIRQMLITVGLDPDDKRKISKYSLGMRQRLALAQALMENPELIILDEPTNSLDEEGVALLYRLLRERRDNGATVLIASHSAEDIEALCDKKYYMYMGRISEVPWEKRFQQ